LPKPFAMIDKLNYRHIGTITKTHGVEGELTLRLLPNIDADAVNPYFLFLDLDGGLVPFYLESLRDRGDGSLLVGFEHLNTETKARRLLETDVWIADDDYQEARNDEGDIHSSMLVGYSVEDDVHGLLGKIVELRDPERNPLFVVDGAKGEILIPVADEFITGLDQAKKILFISTPEGLIDLNVE
jgi:16S rRNA processing protein RimM